MIDTTDSRSIPPQGLAPEPAQVSAGRGLWQRLGYAALGFYCLKGLCWLLIGWYALGPD